MYHLYIGNLESRGFKWDGGDYSGNIPDTLYDLGSAGGIHGMLEAKHLLESASYGGKVLDWGASGAILNKTEILRFAGEFYGLPIPAWILEPIARLDENTRYVLFACED